jgi:RNA polymerase sigma-70 factor, ECF subfamily
VALVAGSRDAAEDAVQEALVRAWERPAGAERIDSLPAWVTRVSLNLAKSRLRRIRAEARARQRLPIAEADAPGTAATDVERALATLPRRQREVTVLRYYLAMDLAEIAEVLGVTQGTVKTQLFRARRALAALLGEAADDEREVEARARHR